MSHSKLKRDSVEREQPFFRHRMNNWMAKNGLPPVLACTHSAKYRAGSTRTAAHPLRAGHHRDPERLQADLMHPPRRCESPRTVF